MSNSGKKGKANNLNEGRNKEIRGHGVDLSSAEPELLEIKGRGLRPGVDLSRLSLMMIS